MENELNGSGFAENASTESNEFPRLHRVGQPGARRRILPQELVRRNNSRVAELVSLYLNLTPDAITPDMVESLSRDARIERPQAYAMMLAILCGIDFDGDDRALYYNYFIPMVDELDASEFECDPYYRAVHLTEKSLGSWRLCTMKLKPCEAFVRRDFVVTKRGELIPQLGYFMREFSYPAVLESGREWMTLMPNETVTTKPAIEKAHGRVLTYGLGLGYFAYMASRKDSVESVTVVERSREAAELFRAEILPQFGEYARKIELRIGDAIDFAQNEAVTGGFDFIFTDIWHDAGDGRELYRKFKSFEPLYPAGTEFSYWLEDSILCYEDKSLWDI